MTFIEQSCISIHAGQQKHITNNELTIEIFISAVQEKQEDCTPTRHTVGGCGVADEKEPNVSSWR